MAYNKVEDSFTAVLAKDLLHLVCSEKLGEGVARIVYASRLDPGVVIKFEPDAYSFQNIAEWEIWKQVQGTRMERWFAPCIEIAASGTVLIQKRCQPILGKLPKQLPQYLCDLKRENFGMIDGKLVCHDYGTMLYSLRSLPKKMAKAEWFA